MAYVNLQTHEGTVSGANKQLAKLVPLDFFIALARILLLTPLLKINIAVLLQKIVNYSQIDAIISFNSVFR